MKLFEQLHIRFLIIPLVIVGSLLAVTFCTIFGITYYSTTNEINDGLHNIASSVNVTDVTGSRSLIVLIIDDGSGTKRYEAYNFYDYTDAEVANVANSLTSNSGSFVSNSHRLKYEAKQPIMVEGKIITAYALVDCTEQYKTLSTLGFTLLSVYIVSLAIIAGLSYILAYNATKPVKEAFEKERDLVANASHELKTPLTVARTNLDLVASDPNLTVEDNIKWIDSARYQIDRMNSLILQMLELSKIERDDYKVEKTQLNISELIEGVLLSFEAGCYENNIRFVSDIQPNITYLCNKIETEKLITILVDNALKYTPKEGEICVTMAKTLKLISIKVTNTGDGIPQEKINRIFERFYKLDESHKESGNSFGLGLSIAKLISTSMGGDIKCYSEVGKYTTFEIILPTH